MSCFYTKGLSIGYEVNRPLQQNINISLEKGQIITLMGQNGVGKTTFLKTISKLIPSLAGAVYYSREPLDQLTSQDLSTKLSIVLTERPAAGNLTVFELVTSGRHPFTNWLGRLSAEDRNVIDWAISETQINYIANKKLSQLSDGQLQKVMIARALAQQTEMIFLDEPTAHLDLHNKIEIMLLLKQISQQGKGILISTHDLPISLQLSDKMWLFNFTEPVREGVPEDLILDGSIEKTLFLEDFHYDFETGSFEASFETNPREIHLTGDRSVVYWTQHALKKIGYRLTDRSNVPSIQADLRQWTYYNGKESITFKSIEALIGFLK